MPSIENWLRSIGLSEYTEAFARHDISCDLLESLDDQALREMGVHSLGHRLRLLKAASATTEPGAIESESADSEPATDSERSGERRQLTVLFCDLVGFTDLAVRLDPEQLSEVIQRYEDACTVETTRYGGHLYQRLGDGIVAFFGYPLAHEDSAQLAIHAALAMADSVRAIRHAGIDGLSVRVGVATGWVVISSLESGAIGVPMNLAARLQSLASSGEVLITGEVRRMANGRFLYESLGKVDLKGIPMAIPVHRVLGVNPIRSRFAVANMEGVSPMVGREQDLGLLLNRWDLSREGEGQVVLLSGEMGIGKSRIASALREQVKALGGRTLGFQCSPCYVKRPYHACIDYLEKTLDLHGEQSVAAKLAKLQQFMVHGHGFCPEDVPYVATMLGLEAVGGSPEAVGSPRRWADETARVMVDLLEAAARKRPTLVLFEDAHWADQDTLEILDLLMERVRAFPILVLITHRSEFGFTWSRHDNVTALNLGNLTAGQVRTLVAKIAGPASLPPHLVDEVVARADGVPLYVEAMTHEALELKLSPDPWAQMDKNHSLKIPQSVRDALMARLDRHADSKSIAQLGALIGREFSFAALRRIASVSDAALMQSLDDLTRAGLLHKRGTAPYSTYRFKHALMRDAAFDGVLHTQRDILLSKLSASVPDVASETPGMQEKFSAVREPTTSLSQEAEAKVSNEPAYTVLQAVATCAEPRHCRD